MKKNILILSTSPRKNGNSEMLAREFARGAEEAGHNVELLSLHDKTIGFCQRLSGLPENAAMRHPWTMPTPSSEK